MARTSFSSIKATSGFTETSNACASNTTPNLAEISFVSSSAARTAYAVASNGFKEGVRVSLKDEVIEVGPREAVGKVILSMGPEARGIARIEEPQESLMELLARMYQSERGEGEEVDQA